MYLRMPRIEKICRSLCYELSFVKSHQNQFDSYTFQFSNLSGIDLPSHISTCQNEEDMDPRPPHVDSGTVDQNTGFIDMPDLSYTIPNLDKYIL